MSKKNTVSRKDFLTYSAVGAVGVLGVPAILTSCTGGGNAGRKSAEGYTPLKQPGEYYIPNLPDKAEPGKELKVGLVGCGGRGNGAAENILNAADGIKIVALGDVFADRVEEAKKKFNNDYNQEIPEDKCFVGFDAYQKVIDAGIDIVLLCTPPAFRPEHFRYSVEKGVHSFIEKPILVDPVGYRTIIAASKQAESKGLSCVTGTQRHHQRPYVESYKKIQEGLIGRITGGAVYWNQTMLWYRNREAGWSDMEWMIRDWVNWKWLSGDHIVEQHVHNIDVFTWFSGLKPVRALGFGSRHRRITGDQYDNFSVDFEFENGIHMHSMCRQIDGTDTHVGEFVQGTLGSWSSDFSIKDLDGNVIWKYEDDPQLKQDDPYILEHVNLVNCIRRNEPIMQAPETAIASLAAVMGRESAYSGKYATWDEWSQSPLSVVPQNPEMGKVDMSQFVVPVPGSK